MRSAAKMLDDLVKIFRLYMGIPIFLRIEHYIGTLLTGAKTHVGFYIDILQSLCGNPFLQFRQEIFRAARLTIDI